MARSKSVFAIFIGLGASVLACQAIVGLDKFSKFECTTDCGTDVVVVDAPVDAGPDVMYFGEASVANRWIKWPMPNPKDAETPVNMSVYDAAGTGEGGAIVRDFVTSLAWTQSDLGTMSYLEAIAKCESIGFRLPTRIELVSLLDYTRAQPAIDPAFQGSKGGLYWTQSPLPNKTQVWVVDFGNPKVTSLSVDAQTMAHVRCVQ